MDNMGELINKFIDNLTPTDKTKKIGIGMKFSDGVEYLNNRNRDKKKLKKNLELIEGFGGFDSESDIDVFIDNLSKFYQYQKDFDNSYNEIKKNVRNCKTKCYDKFNGMSNEKYGCDVACTLKGPDLSGACAPIFDPNKRISDTNYCFEKPYYEILDNDQSKTFLKNIDSCDQILKKTGMEDSDLDLAKYTCNNLGNNDAFKSYMEYNNDLKTENRNITTWEQDIIDREEKEKERIGDRKSENLNSFNAANVGVADLGTNIDEYRSQFSSYKKMSGETNDTLIGMNEDLLERVRTKRVYYYLWGLLAFFGISLAAIQIRKRIR